MQMGPASLPTPLSPMRGLPSWQSHLRKRLAPVFQRLPGEPDLSLPSPALAPASGSVGWRVPVRRPFLSRSAVPRPVEPCWPVISNGSAQARTFAVPRPPTGSSGLATALLSRPSQAVHLHPAETFCRCSSKTARTVSVTSKRSGKFHVFRSLDRQTGSFPRPFDVFRLRPGNESGKFASPQLSTFRRFRCGHEWISQPLIAKSAGPSQRAFLSRCASSRSRSALSRMKPCASFWS